MNFHILINFVHFYHCCRAPDNFQVQLPPTFENDGYSTVVLATSEKIAYMYTFKIKFDTSHKCYSINAGCISLFNYDCVMLINKML